MLHICILPPLPHRSCIGPSDSSNPSTPSSIKSSRFSFPLKLLLNSSEIPSNVFFKQTVCIYANIRSLIFNWDEYVLLYFVTIPSHVITNGIIFTLYLYMHVSSFANKSYFRFLWVSVSDKQFMDVMPISTIVMTLFLLSKTTISGRLCFTFLSVLIIVSSQTSVIVLCHLLYLKLFQFFWLCEIVCLAEFKTYAF